MDNSEENMHHDIGAEVSKLLEEIATQKVQESLEHSSVLKPTVMYCF